MYPIIMTTYERVCYFERTMESIEKSDIDLSYLHIFDDGSKQPFKLDILKNLEKKYTIHYSEKNQGTVLNTIPNIDYLYEKYDSEYIIFLQDDVIFSKNWLINGLEMFKEINSKYLNIAYLCLFNRTNDFNRLYYIMSNSHPGGVAWIINRKFWSDYRETYDIDDYGLEKLSENDKKKHHKVKNLVDYKLSHRAHIMTDRYENGWYIAKTGKSLVLHIGDRSTLVNGDMRWVRDDGELNFVGEDA